MAAKKQKSEVIDVQQVAIPRGEIVRAALADQVEADASLAFVKDVAIQNSEHYVFAGNALKEVAQRHDQIKAKRDAWTKPLQVVIDDIKSTLDPVVKAYAAMEATLKEKIGGFAVRKAEEKASLVALASACYGEGDRDKATAFLESAKECDISELPGVGVKAGWTGELVDGNVLIDAVLSGKLGREYLKPNIEMCQAATDNKQGDPGIPGWRAYVKAAVRTSRKG